MIDTIAEPEVVAVEAVDRGAPPAGAEGATKSSPTARLSRVTARLTLTNGSVALVGILTGPLQARALGPVGRGELAAIMTPLGFLPTLASVGLGTYVEREVARGRRPGVAVGSLLPVCLGIGFAIAAVSPLIAGALANGRPVVYAMLVLGLVLFPLSAFILTLINVAIGLEDWRPVMTCRVIPPTAQLIFIPVLFLTHTLTVTSAAILSFGASMMLLLPLLGTWRRCRPLGFELAELRTGVAYGAKCWVGGLSSLANARLDQLLMVALVSSRVLGLYAIAVTLATFFISPIASAVGTAAGPRVSRGADDLARRLCRMTLYAAAVLGLAVAVLSPFVLRYAFGPAFADALPMTLILLVGTVPNAAGGILSMSVSAGGHPGYAARGETVGLVVTVAGLAVALPTLGDVGAALVSVAAYTAQFAYMVRAAKRFHGGRYRDYLVLNTHDRQTLSAVLRRRVARLFMRR
ncbi:MAG TPA: oligosaccharide flippase family protein [Solirubrobacteraceae bacterium]|jgi:O-antigen/teichoic acid export membrane protein